jgi:hypothetical protein
MYLNDARLQNLPQGGFPMQFAGGMNAGPYGYGMNPPANAQNFMGSSNVLNQSQHQQGKRGQDWR